MPMASPVERISGPRTVSTTCPSAVVNRLKGSTTPLTATGSAMSNKGAFPDGSAPSSRSRAMDRPIMIHAAASATETAGRLGHERDRPGGARVGFDHVERVLHEPELDVEQAADPHAGGDGLGGRPDPVDDGLGERDGRKDAGGVARVDPALLDVLHHARQVELPAVVEGVDVDLGGGVEEAVDEQGGRAAGRPSAFAAAPAK